MGNPSDINPDQPMRLADIVKIAFPTGGMTVAGLRREIKRERLTVEVIAGKHFTTLAHIEEMRRLCRVKAKGPDYSSNPPVMTGTETSPTEQHGSSATTAGMSAQDALRMKLQTPKKPCKTTSRANTGRNGKRKTSK